MPTENENQSAQVSGVPLQPVVRFSILPCPFCGTSAVLNSVNNDHWVICEDSDCAFSTDFISAPDVAVEVWNDLARNVAAHKSNNASPDK